MITAEMYPVEVGKVALLKSSHRLVFVLEHYELESHTVTVTYEHDGEFTRAVCSSNELETPEARMIEEVRFQKFVFDLTAQVNEKAKKGPELVQ